jgi:hypothetical protein
MKEVERVKMTENLGVIVSYMREICQEKSVSHLHEDVHGHAHELGESTGLRLPDRRLCSWFRATSGPGFVYFGAFTLRRARRCVGIFLSIERGTAAGFGGHGPHGKRVMT